MALALVLTACTEKAVRLTFWVGGAPQEVDYWLALISDFEKESGIDVEVVRQPTATEQRKQGLVIALEARRPDPDVFLMDIVWIPMFIQSDWLLPLDPFFRRESVHPRLFFESVVETVDRHRDRYYALPVYLDVGVLYYRRDLLRRHGFDGPPQTWEALVRQALKVQQAERTGNRSFNGFLWQGAQYEGLVCTFLEFAAGYGADAVTGGTVDLAAESTIEALGFMRDLIARYRISPPNTYTEMREENVRRAFQRGNALFERNWLYAWSLHQRPGSEVRGRVGLAPLPSRPGAQPAATLGGWHLGISKTSDAREDAWRLVEYLLSRQTQKNFLMHLGWYPGRKDVYVDPEVRRKVVNVKTLEKILERAVSRPVLPYYEQVSVIIQRYVNDCLAGRRSAPQALEAMLREIGRVEEFYGQK